MIPRAVVPLDGLLKTPVSVLSQRPAPRAVEINQVAIAGGVEITLLSYAVVEETLRMYGALRVTAEHAPVLVGVPALELIPGGGGRPPVCVGAHVVPMPPVIWLAWTFRMTGAGPVIQTARIGDVELGFRVGRRTETVVGPWVFEGIAGTTGGLDASPAGRTNGEDVRSDWPAP